MCRVCRGMWGAGQLCGAHGHVPRAQGLVCLKDRGTPWSTQMSEAACVASRGPREGEAALPAVPGTLAHGHHSAGSLCQPTGQW